MLKYMNPSRMTLQVFPSDDSDRFADQDSSKCVEILAALSAALGATAGGQNQESAILWTVQN
jgi:hypothetical protein